MLTSDFPGPQGPMLAGCLYSWDTVVPAPSPASTSERLIKLNFVIFDVTRTQQIMKQKE